MDTFQTRKNVEQNHGLSCECINDKKEIMIEVIKGEMKSSNIAGPLYMSNTKTSVSFPLPKTSENTWLGAELLSQETGKGGKFSTRAKKDNCGATLLRIFGVIMTCYTKMGIACPSNHNCQWAGGVAAPAVLVQ